MVYTIVSIVCTSILILLFLFVARKIIFSNRADRIAYVKSFKKGKVFIVYLAAYPLCYIAERFSGANVGVSIFTALKDSVDLVVAKFDFSTPLFSQNKAYTVAVYVCLILVTLNAFMLTASFCWQTIANTCSLNNFRHGKDDKCIILGYNPKSVYLYKSCYDKKVIAGTFENAECDKMYVDKIVYKRVGKDAKLFSWLDREIKILLGNFKGTHSKLNVIVNTGVDSTNLDLCSRFVYFINACGKDVIDNIDMYVYGDREFEDVYAKYEAQSLGCLHYVSEHRQIAVDLIDNHPFTEFMTEKHFDKDTSLLKPETKLNVALVGFGRVNQQVFLTSVANNQFLKQDEKGEIFSYPVSYYLFDRNSTGEHKNLNHTYYRYEHEFFKDGKVKVNEDDYLPLPPLPANSRYVCTDINSLDFYDDVKDALSSEDTTLNYIVVALGNDYVNIDMANKLVAKLREWKLKNTRVFVRIRNNKIFEKASLCTVPDVCVSFGNEKKVVFDYAHVTSEKFTEMAIAQNFRYDVEHDLNHKNFSEEEKQKSRMSWHVKRTLTEKESNVYGVLSLKLKLNLMGLTYTEKSDPRKGLSYDEYMSIYAKNDMPEIIHTDDGRKAGIKYPLHFKESRRKNLAVLEHYRWNAFMIMNGFIPASKDVIYHECDETGKHTNGKSYNIRRHGNLTTFDGLYDFRRLVAERDKTDETEKDVIKYDYQLLDGAWQLLDDNGYKIVVLEQK